MVGPAALVALVLSSVSAMKDAASPMSASSLIHARTVYEDQVHVQLARWCNATLPAQTSRRSALQRLLEQAQTTAGKSPKLVALEQEVASLGNSLEKQRIGAEASRAAQDRHALEAKLDLSDVSADVKALSTAVKIIDSKHGTPGYKSVQDLLTQAQTSERQLQTKAQLLQTTGSSSGASAKAQAEYQSKRAEKDQLQHLYFTTQRSLGVLTSALEDESAYLSDLQSICGAEQDVQHRLQGSTLPELNKVLVESEKPVPRVVSAIQVAPKVVESAPVAPTVSVVHEVSTTVAPAPVVHVTVAPAPKKVPPVAMMEKQDSATEETVHPRRTARAPIAHTHVSAKAKKVATTAPPAADDEDSDDDAPLAATTTLPPTTTTHLKHKKHHKKHHKADVQTTTTTTTTAPPTTTAKATPAPTTTLSDDDAEEQAMEALQGPAKKEAPPPAPKAVATPKNVISSAQKTVKKHKHTTAAPADDDSDDDAPAPTTAAPTTTTEAPTTTAAPDPAVPAAPTDDDDFSHPKEGVQAFVAKKKKSHKKKAEKKKDEFLDGIYSAAAGYMPATYSAWKPDGVSSAPHTPPPLAAGKNAMDSMKAMMDTSDDDSANIDQAMKIEVPKHPKWAPSPPPAAGQSQPAADAAPATTVAPTGGDGEDPFDESPSANTPSTTPAPKTTAASQPYDLTDDGGDSSSPPQTTTTTQPPPPPPAASKDPFADDDDTPPPTEAPHHHHKKKHHTTTAAAAADPFGDDDDSSSAPAPTTTVAPKPKVSLEQTGSSSDPDVPDQYAAYVPSDKPTDPKQNSMVQSFESGWDDGDSQTKKKKHLRHKKHKTTTPAPQADSDGVVYDDDDLPKHHPKPFEGLEGGWKAFMKPSAEKKKPKLDADVQIMQNLYTDDGGLPGQYTAWTPAAATTAAPAQAAAASDDSDDDADDGGDSFMQMESRKKVSDPVARLIRAAVSAAEDVDAPALIEEATVAVDASRRQAADVVLAQFAQTLQSKPLQQLVQAKLSPPKLAALFQKLQSVDPLKHPSHSSEQAEQACLFFEDNAQSASPVTQSAFKVEKGTNDVAEALSHQSALLEEMNARIQLKRTMEQDVSSLTTLLKTARQGQDISGLSTAEAQLDKQGRTSSGAELAVAAEGVQAAHAELGDLLQLTLQKRSLALKTQEAKVALLQTEQKTVNVNVDQKSALVSQAAAEMKAAEQKLSGIQAACGQALASLEQRRHTGHMEAHAIGTVLKVVGTL